jgi:hypothetical protein
MIGLAGVPASAVATSLAMDADTAVEVVKGPDVSPRSASGRPNEA